MRFISKYRRHRFAGPLLLLAGLLFVGFGYTVAQAASQTVVTNPSDKATLIALHVMDSMPKAQALHRHSLELERHPLTSKLQQVVCRWLI